MQTNLLKQKTLLRISWIDICRGIAIVLVMYGHLFASDKSRYLIYSFHMPLFFFISGLVFKPTDKPLLTTAIKYFKQLLIPYYSFALFTYLFAIVSQTTQLSWSGAAYQLWGIIYGSGNMGMLGYNVVLWFLPCLFITKFSFAVITKKISKTKLLLTFLFASALIGSLLYLTMPWIKLPLGLESGLTGLPFFGTGYLLMKHKALLSNFLKYKLILAVFAMIGTWFVATINYHISGSQVDMRINQLGNVPLFYLGAFGGIAGWTIISQIVAKNAFLEYVGKHSLVIFAWHNILFTDLENIINSVLTQDILTSIHPIMSTVYVIMAISIILFSRFILVRLKSIIETIIPVRIEM